MPSFDLAFVDQVSASPSTRLDLNGGNPLTVMADGTDFGMPELREARSATLLADGDYISASAYGNRLIRLRIQLPADPDAAAPWFQKIAREVNRPANLLRYRAGTTDPVFFRTYRGDFPSVEWDGVSRFCTVAIEADYAAAGLKETLPAVTVYNDPLDGLTLNANPFFETDVSGWQSTGGTFVRSTAQFHEGVASGLLTPDGVTASVFVRSSASSVVAPGQAVRYSGWLRCAAARNVTLQIEWRDAGDAVLSYSAGVTISVSANAWTFFSGTDTAPASTAGARLIAVMASTPSVSHQLHVDEMRMRLPGSAGAMYFDVTGVRGDVDTPLFLQVGSSAFSGITVTRRVAIGSRRRGTPAGAPFVLQAESMTTSTDTTLPGNDATASGTGSNYARVSGWTNANLIPRLTADPWPAAAGTDVRGTYRVYVRVKGSPAGASSAQLQLRWGILGLTLSNDAVTVPFTVNSTTWGIVDLGLIQFPLGVDPGTDGLSGADLPVRGMRIELAVGKGATTTNVDVDYLVFVPADDQFAVVGLQRDITATAAVIDPARRIAYMVGASGEVRSTAGSPISIAGLLPYARPGVTNRYAVVLAADGQTAGDLISDSVTITPYYWPQYLYVRGVGS